jgi:hypothetical protein
MTKIKTTNFEIKCPHCGEYVIVEQINCAIFRHGVLKSTMTQINPHLPKPQCDKLKEQDLIYGCGKPFKIILNENKNCSDNKWMAIECDYI